MYSTRSQSRPRRLATLARWAVLTLVSVAPKGGTQEAIEPIPEPVVVDVQPREGLPGDTIRILGSGFGGIPENLSVSVSQDDGRAILLEVLRAKDSEILAKLGPIPEVSGPGKLTVFVGSGGHLKVDAPTTPPDRSVERPIWVEARNANVLSQASSGDIREVVEGPAEPATITLSGNGSRPTQELLYSNVRVAGDVVVWHRAGLPTATAPQLFRPRYATAPYGERWGVAVLQNGQLCLPVNPDWSQASHVRIHARVAVEGSTDSWEVRVTEAELPAGASALENAKRIAELVEAVLGRFTEMGAVCRVEMDASETPELVLGLHEGLIGGGALNVEVRGAAVSLHEPVVIRSAKADARGMRFRFQSQAGRHYRVQVNGSLREEGWTDLQRAVGVGGPMVVEDSEGSGSMRIYRVIEE